MKRWTVLGFAAATVVATLAIAVAAPAAATAERPAGRVIVITLDGTSLEDWLRADTFHLRRAIERGTPGLLSARTGRAPARTEPACLGRAGDALATMLTGTRATSADLTGSEPLRSELAGIGTGVAVALRTDSAFPTGQRTDFERLAALVREARDRLLLIRIPDTLAADCAGGAQRDRWVDVTLGRADAIVGVAASMLGPGDRLIVLSAAAPVRSERAKNYLAAATILDPSRDANAILTSPSTRRRGIVALTDVAATIGARFGLDPAIGVGRPWAETRGNVASLRGTLRDYSRVSAARAPIMRGLVWIAVALLLLSGIVVVSGRGRAGGGRVPRTGRDWLAAALLAIVAAPFAMIVESVVRPGSPGGSAAVVAAVAAAVALGASAARTLARATGGCATLSALTLLAFLGSGEWGARSVLSFSVAGADRFYGVGNEAMGVVVVSLLLAAGSWIDRRPQALRWAAAAGLIAAGAMAAPVAGAKFGSIFVAVPAVAVFVLAGGGRRIGRHAALGIAIATVMLAGVIAAWNLLSSPEAASHVARAAGDGGAVSRKIGAAIALAAGSYWTAAIAAAALIAAVLLRRRSALLARGMWGRPGLRAALRGSAVAAAAAAAFNDAGIVAAALIAIVASAAALHALLVGQAAAARPSETARRLRAFAS